MNKHLKIDFVSDVSCPWCAIGLAGLKQALDNLHEELDAEIIFDPYELNPGMPAGGQNFAEHVMQKYGSTPAQLASNQQSLIARAAEAGFRMAVTTQSRIYNTFDAHRLLHWASLQGRQMELKRALFDLNFTENRDVGDSAVLQQAAARAGLDPVQAQEVIGSDHYAAEVRAEIDQWRARGVASVPTLLINDKYLLTGGLPVEDFEKALRQIAGEG